jgi:uncharacterized membrane protein (DUF4010 family)
MGMMFLAAAVPAAFYFRRGMSTRRGARARGEEIPLRNPFGLAEAARFAAFFAVILVVVKLVERYSVGEGMYLVAAIAGTTDVDAIALSMAEYAKEADARIAIGAIAIAALVNTLVKCGLVVGFGGAAMRRPVLTATGIIVAAGIAAIAVW